MIDDMFVCVLVGLAEGFDDVSWRLTNHGDFCGARWLMVGICWHSL